MLIQSLTFMTSKGTQLRRVEAGPYPHGHFGQMRQSKLPGDCVYSYSRLMIPFSVQKASRILHIKKAIENAIEFD